MPLIGRRRPLMRAAMVGGAAYATGEEHIKGKLAPGYYADFVVLGDNPLTANPKTLSEVPVLATYVAGDQVWTRGET